MRYWIRPRLPALSIALLSILASTGCSDVNELEQADVVAPEPAATIEFRLAEDEPGLGLEPVKSDEWPETLYVHEEIVISNEDLVSASIVERDGALHVEVEFTKGCSERFANVTGENIDKKMAILVDGKLVSAPVIRDRIRGGRAIISGNFSAQEARRIAGSIKGNANGE